jgi:enoyl-CoA hydratase
MAIHFERRDSVTVVRMEHGKANAFDRVFLADLRAALGDARENGAGAVVLTGTGSIFSAGVDLFRLVQGGDDYARAFVPEMANTLLEVFAAPLPVVAAVNGHAIAGGCILACACDHRLMAEGKGTIGIPELLVGVPFPSTAVEIMRYAVPAHELQALVYTARTLGPEEAVRRGVIDEVTPADRLLDRAVEMASKFGQIPRHVFASTKAALRAAALERMQADTSMDTVVSAWSRVETRAAIQQYLDRTISKGNTRGAVCHDCSW